MNGKLAVISYVKVDLIVVEFLAIKMSNMRLYCSKGVLLTPDQKSSILDEALVV